MRHRPIQLIVTDDPTSLNHDGADFVADVIATNPTSNILVATGSTPMGLYHELAARRTKGDVETSQVRAVQLDEYLDVPIDDRRSLYGWMLRSFIEPLGIAPEHVIRLPGDTPDPEGACRAFDEAVRVAGGIDLAILGLGPNGHLGFNEPPSAADAPTRVVDLTEESIHSNGRYWGGREHVPRRALTAGMTILRAARQTLLVVSGAHKRDILRRAVFGPVTPNVPASFLQQIPGVTILADRDAWGREDALP